ncbi:MAG: helix-turn-helix domain-containing protein, partial [Firmicutes bacterium]|nr:helix-turn-helix domain-containing protein [Bacillota bacterium]
MELKICGVIKRKRREMNISQEALAEKLGITVQAVSKWENNLSYPDISLLPQIADFFGISMDTLFFDNEKENAAAPVLTDIPDDGKLRVVQCVGSRVLSREECGKDNKISLIVPEIPEKTVNVEIWGGAEIQGDISGDLK